ncbi:MAG: hypothetical protein KGL95_02510, partial [Patescibacteria group bacterium]|nr:hypothetical protein [Patescibacteria group bacterium]
MEQSPAQLQVAVKDRIIPKESTERKSKSLRDETIDHLRKGKPINVPHGNMQGDNLIHWWATSRVLLKLCEEAKPPIELDQDSLPISSGSKEGINIFERAREIIDDDPALELDRKTTLSHQRMQLLANALGVPMTEEELNSIPQPLKTDYNPMSEFDRDKALKRAAEIEENERDSA